MAWKDFQYIFIRSTTTKGKNPAAEEKMERQQLANINEESEDSDQKF